MLFYRSFGSPEKQLLVFLHGFLGSHKDFLPIIKRLQNDFFCVAIDLPGHGKSPYQKEILHLVEETIARLSQKPILVGYSMGGRIALHLNKPLEAMYVLAFSAHTGVLSSEERQQKRQEELLWKKRLLSLSPKDFIELWYKQPIFHTLHENKELLKKRLYKNPKELAHILEEMRLTKLPPPTLYADSTVFFFGENDNKYKEHYKLLSKEYLAQEIPHAGHSVILENPKKCAELIKNQIVNLKKRRPL